MNISSEKQATSFLFRLRSQDTLNGVSDETLNKLIKKTGMNKTEVLHLALRKLADEYLPSYEAEENDFTDTQIQYLRDNSPAKHVPEESFMKLY